MSDNGSVDIRISKSQNPDGVSTASMTGNNQINKNEQGKTSFGTKALNAAIISGAQQGLSYGLSIYEDMTYDSVTTDKLNNAFGIMADAGILLKGGAIGGAFLVAKNVMAVSRSNIKQFKEDLKTERAVNRAGIISESGSR